ncbi:MAG: hypothetical protein P9X26_03585 [Candidatus Stygibacter frigidus]|nr:hypothetical protein [Candidatus Stygibacter frigidus]
MRKIFFAFFILYFALLTASLSDYQSEFGFPMDKPRHGRYHFQRELLSIEQDPQIMTYQPVTKEQMALGVPAPETSTELDNFSLSDTTLVLNTAALNDLDLFSNLKMDTSIGDDRMITSLEDNMQYKPAQPADYNLYIQMPIPDLIPKQQNQIEFIPVTSRSQQELQSIDTQIQSLFYQIDNIYNNENMVIPQYGSIDFNITIDSQGIIEVNYKITAGNFSRGFITTSIDTIKRWQITSPVKIQYSLSRNYLQRP